MQPVLNRFGLARAPFTKEISSAELFNSATHERATARLVAAVEVKASALLVGDSGVGKTCVLRGLQQKLNPARYRVHYMHHANVNPRDFYRQLSMVLGLEPKASPSAMFRMVQGHMEELGDEHKVHPVLLLDEAQLIPLSMLEQLHILLNFRMDSRAFLSIVLVGLPELRERLGRNLLGSLSSRLPARIHLDPLSGAEVGDYLRHRLLAAGSAQEVFSEDAILQIREATAGVLRRVDILAQTCLDVAARGKGVLVDGTVVLDAVEECADALR